MRPVLLAALFALALPAGLEAAGAKLSPAELAAKIDEHIDAKLKAAKVVPAPLASDAELVRRMYLDLNGCIPDILAARDFIDNPKADKKARLVRELLSRKATNRRDATGAEYSHYAWHWSSVWRNWLVGGSNDQQVLATLPQLEMYLRQELNKNTAYDKMVRDLIVVDPSRGVYGTSGYVFYQANQFRAESLTATTTRLFLGIKLECAQCHNHPFAKWDKKHFWEMAAFYSGNVEMGRPGFRGTPTAGTGEIEIPNTGKKVKAKFLDGKEPKMAAGGDYRIALVDWMTTKDNPYFARAMVNRVWENLMGNGLVEPLDEESKDNPPSHPKLLGLLAQQFAEHDFDQKYLIEAIVLSKAYQRTSRQTHPSQADPALFARQRVRGLTPEQLFDSLALATGSRSDDSAPAFGVSPFGPVNARQDFLRRFPNQDKRSEQETSILQALYLMNGKLVDEATSLEHNENLKVIAKAKALPTGKRVQQVFLIVLGRKPTAAETKRLVKYVDAGGPTRDSARALCDVFWALLNSSEFCTNH